MLDFSSKPMPSARATTAGGLLPAWQEARLCDLLPSDPGKVIQRTLQSACKGSDHTSTLLPKLDGVQQGRRSLVPDQAACHLPLPAQRRRLLQWQWPTRQALLPLCLKAWHNLTRQRASSEAHRQHSRGLWGWEAAKQPVSLQMSHQVRPSPGCQCCPVGSTLTAAPAAHHETMGAHHHHHGHHHCSTGSCTRKDSFGGRWKKPGLQLA